MVISCQRIFAGNRDLTILEKAFNLLRSVFEEREINELSLLEQEGFVKRFEYTYELAWKTLKDYLEYNGSFIKFKEIIIKIENNYLKMLNELYIFFLERINN